MKEIYWITRLDNIKDLVTMLIVVSIVLLAASLFYFLCKEEDYREGSNEYKKNVKLLKKNSIICGILFLIFVVSQALIPSKEDALIIYGVGGTIDYLKSNDVAKKLPDKCILALDKYLDSITIDKKDSIK